MKWKDSYYGWLIELIPLSEGYMFKCWMSDEQVGISNNYIYPSLYQALRAAMKRAKFESASLTLINFLNDAYKNCNLTPQEHISLVGSILDCTSSANNRKIRDY